MSGRGNNSNSCPKCGSRSVYLDWEENDRCQHCLLCGFEVPLKAPDMGKEKGKPFSDNSAYLKTMGI